MSAPPSGVTKQDFGSRFVAVMFDRFHVLAATSWMDWAPPNYVCCYRRSPRRGLTNRMWATTMLYGRLSTTPRACGSPHSSFTRLRFHTRQVGKQCGVYLGAVLIVQRNVRTWSQALNFHLFGPLKKHFTGKVFATDAEVKQVVTF